MTRLCPASKSLVFPVWALLALALPRPAGAQQGWDARRQADALRYLATTAGFDTVSTEHRPWPEPQPMIPEGDHRTHVSPGPPEPAAPGAPQPADGLVDAEFTPPDAEFTPPDAEFTPPDRAQPAPPARPETVHKAMPEGTVGGPGHAPMEILVTEEFVPDTTAFVLTLVDVDGVLLLPPTVRVGDTAFELNDVGNPPDVTEADGRWAAVIERYVAGEPLEILEGVVSWGSLQLAVDGDERYLSLEVQLTGGALSSVWGLEPPAVPFRDVQVMAGVSDGQDPGRAIGPWWWALAALVGGSAGVLAWRSRSLLRGRRGRHRRRGRRHR